MSTSPGETRTRHARWALAVVLTVLVPALLLVVQDARYFFHGDTQAAYLGWQYHLGREVLHGRWPLIDPHAWHAANLAAEGQSGLFSPLLVGIGVLATLAGNVLVFATAVKLALACVGALGVFALARSYGAAAPLAYVAAVAAPLGGMTQYLDLASWVAGLMIWALLPWVWWALRRLMLAGANPLAALVLGYLLVSVGYVYGTIMLILVLLGCLLECRLARDRSATWRVLGVGVVCGLVAFTVYLPGVLTAPVTKRGSGFALSGKFDSDPLQLLSSVLSTAAVPGTTLHVLPYAYAVWFLPVLLWVDLDRLRRGWRPLAGLLLTTAVMLLVMVGPARVGPLRWPLRLQPFLVQALVVLCAVLLSRYAVRRPSRRRLLAALAWVGAAGVVALLRYPGGWAALAVAVLLGAGGTAALWWVVRGRRTPRLVAAGCAVAVGVSLVSMLLQHAVFPDLPSPERNLPAAAADYRTQLTSARGDVMVVGDVMGLLEADPTATTDLLDGSAWYLNPHRVQNMYTTIGFSAYDDRFPMDYDGSTSPALLDTLFSIEPTTGRRRVDLLAVSTLLLVRDDFPAVRLAAVPSGWRVSASTRHTVTWVRTRPVPGAGSPVWASPGTQLSRVSVDDRQTRFRVDRVPAGGGRVVLGMLDWPGYRTDVGELAAPVDGYLVTARLPADAAGRTVTVRFSPPAWPFEVACWWLAVVGGLAWCVSVSQVMPRNRRRPR